MKKTVLIVWMIAYVLPGISQTNLVVDPNSRYQTIEGWGVSLAWWANVAGGWSDDKIDTLCTWLTSPTGLNMNVFRFNIAGEENPAHNHFRYSAQLQGYKTTEAGPYDFTRDLTQRKILLKLKTKRSDCIFEAIAYSPPYWMTNSGCTAGNTGGTDNLKTAYYDDFADYLTEVVKYYHDNYGITFRTLAPINEPSSGWWYVNGGQAGCHFSSANQVSIFNEVYSKLQSKTMLSYCTLSAMDASNPRETINELNVFAANNILSKISQVNVHAYTHLDSIVQYQQLYDTVKKYQKRLWQSESGPWGWAVFPAMVLPITYT
ncbi:glycoside hydrolase [Paraflavitalea speifideaquila]|uniref:glycoside hydrolase n=1 Tax=Paraflavitalea speifideaquila TaxID=3076558 RepID=UPI0028E1B90C|nr:glycoside hydrolase [Paraflavitalea speifideiaquila]